MKIKKYYIFLIIFSFFLSDWVYSNSNWCKYQAQINQCNSANKNGTVRWIEDFVCIVWTYEELTYQVILDMEFKKLDNEMDTYVANIEKNKNMYFWKSSQKTYIDWVNDIEKKKSYFYKEYRNKCWISLIKEVTACNKNNKTSIKNAKKYFVESDCMLLVNKKLEIFDDITFSILMQNWQQIKADEKKVYDQWQRRNYNKLLDILMINIWYIERIWRKTPSITSIVHK